MFYNEIEEIKRVFQKSSKFPNGAVEVGFVGKTVVFHGLRPGRKTGIYHENATGTNEQGKKKAMIA